MRAELSPRQRIYLLWTFRNFRQLSMVLLNERQRALVIDLFHNNAGIVLPSKTPMPVIGVVENFVPPPMAPITPPAVSATVAKAAPPVSTPVRKAVEIQVEKVEKLVAATMPQPESIARQHATTVSEPEPRRSPSTSLSLSLLLSKTASSVSRLFAFLSRSFTSISRTISRITSETASSLSRSSSSYLPTYAKFKKLTSGLTTSKLATAGGALAICIVSVVGWQRVQVIPSSLAHNHSELQPESAQPVQLQPGNVQALPDSPTAVTFATASGNSTTISHVTATTRPLAAANIPASTSTIPVVSRSIPMPKGTARLTHAASTPKFSIPGDGSIQASRPPLHFAYPDVHTRGVVALTAGVDPDGLVRSVRIVSGKRDLAAAAARAVRTWRYRPYLKDGKPVATETNIVISFFSSDAISMTFPPSIPTTR